MDEEVRKEPTIKVKDPTRKTDALGTQLHLKSQRPGHPPNRTCRLWRRRHGGSAAWASEATQHPLSYKAKDETLNAEADD